MKLLDSSHLSILQEIRDLHAQNIGLSDFGVLWSDNLLLQSLQNQEVYGYLNEVGVLCSFLIVRKVDSETHEIHLTMTRPKMSRLGYMGILFQDWLQTCPKPWQIWLEVHERNLAAIRFYEKQGFIFDTLRPNYYPDGGSAVLYSLRCN